VDATSFYVCHFEDVLAVRIDLNTGLESEREKNLDKKFERG
jgi:hypothetical protein